MEPLDIELEEGELELPTDPMLLNLGPAHPAMHGTVRIVVELSGETITKADVQIGYLHRGFEKMCERGAWTHCFPYVDRLNYASPLLNNIGFSLAVEKMLGVTVPERCQHYRVLLGELARICDHLVCNGAMSMELGAFTPFSLLHQGARDHLGRLRRGNRRARDTQLWSRRRDGRAPDRELQGHGAHGRSRRDGARQRRREAAHRKPHLSRPARGCRRDVQRGCGWRWDGPDPRCARPVCPTMCARRTPT